MDDFTPLEKTKLLLLESDSPVGLAGLKCVDSVGLFEDDEAFEAFMTGVERALLLYVKNNGRLPSDADMSLDYFDFNRADYSNFTDHELSVLKKFDEMTGPPFPTRKGQGAASKVQSVRFNRQLWTQKQAEQWLKKHKMVPIKVVDVTTNELRYRLDNPKKYDTFRTIIGSDGVRFVIGFKAPRKRYL